MNSMTAYCGLLCDNCPIYLATIEKDKKVQESMRKSIADMCFENYGLKLAPAEISDCDGCRAGTGRLFTGCGNCDIRECILGKGIESCALCHDFACERLDRVFSEDPNARRHLNNIRQIHQV